MRLAIINQYFVPDLSPTAHLAASLATHRAKQDDVVSVLCSRSRYQQRDATSSADESAHAKEKIRTILPPDFGLAATGLFSRFVQYLLFFLFHSWRIVLLPKQDMIIALTTPPYAITIAFFHKFFRNWKCKIVLWNMDCYPDILEVAGLIRKRGAVATVLGWLNKLILSRVDHAICLDNSMIERLRRYCPKLSCSVIPNWEPDKLISIQELPTVADNAEAMDGTQKIVHVLYMGNAGYGHEFSSLVEAATELSHHTILFQFIGGGCKHNELKQIVAERGLTNFSFRNYVSPAEKLCCLANADLGLITLSSDAAGIMSPSKLHAKLAAGLPVIYLGPEGSNVHEAIDKFECGVSIRQNDPGELISFLCGILEDPERSLSQMKLNARRAFEEAYCDKKTLAQFDLAINQILGT